MPNSLSSIPSLLHSALASGISKGRLAEEFEVSIATVERWMDGHTLPPALVPLIVSRITAMVRT